MTRHFWTRLSFGAVLLAAGLLPVAAGAQSLAGVAKAEEARRKELAKPSKVYTNQNLRRDPTTPTTPPAAAPASPTDGTSAAAAPTPAPGAATAPAPSDTPAGAAAAPAGPAGPARDQAYWRGRMTAAREQLDRSQTFAAALQSRIDALTLDFVNRDDPAQRSVVEQNRLKALAELERVQREIAAQTKAITAIEDEARKAGVPAGWLR
jgi:hypothetical protein